jgi:L-amino acid N-acyltransferase YncA
VTLRPITRDEANAVIRRWHRHHKSILNAIVKVGLEVDGELVGCVVVERPRAEALCDAVTFEVSRLCCDGTHPHAASKLLGAAWAAARAQGVRRLVSYTRVDEDGTCYRAAGWVATALVDGRKWNTGNKAGRWLPGLYEPSTEIIDRVRWEIGPGAVQSRVHRVAGVWVERTSEAIG